MAYTADQVPTLVDITQAMDPDGSIASLAEILTETNEMLLDIPMMEGNLPTGHKTTIRTGLPQPTWRVFYGGVQPTKSKRAQITDSTAMLQAYGEVDKDMADLNGNAASFRLQEDYAEIEGMSQAAQQAFIYGNQSVNPEQFNGIMPRFNDLSAGNGENIIDAGGTGSDNASILLVVWGPNSAHGIYPKGKNGGLMMDDKGQVTVEDVDGLGGRMEAYRTHYKWDLGLTVRDWRYVVRIANIDRSLLQANPEDGGANLPDLMFEAMERLPSMTVGTPVFYMDRKLRTKLRQQMPHAVKGSTLGIENIGGVLTSYFQEIAIRRVDKMAVNEARVV